MDPRRGEEGLEEKGMKTYSNRVPVENRSIRDQRWFGPRHGRCYCSGYILIVHLLHGSFTLYNANHIGIGTCSGGNWLKAEGRVGLAGIPGTGFWCSPRDACLLSGRWNDDAFIVSRLWRAPLLYDDGKGCVLSEWIPFQRYKQKSLYHVCDSIIIHLLGKR